MLVLLVLSSRQTYLIQRFLRELAIATFNAAKEVERVFRKEEEEEEEEAEKEQK